MRRLTGTEWALLALAILLVGVGFFAVIHPTEMYLYFRRAKNIPAGVEHISKAGSQLHGILAMAVGAGLAWFIVSGRPK
jgi:hypothetical protein